MNRNHSNTRTREPILLYCSRTTQTQEDSEHEFDSDDSEFPPCRIGNLPPLRNTEHGTLARYLREAAIADQQPPTTLRSPHYRQSNTANSGLGQTNIVNTFDSDAATLPGASDGETDLKDNRSLLGKRSVKNRDSLDPSNEHPSKRRYTTSRHGDNSDDNMRWVRREIAGVRETIERKASEVKEDIDHIKDMLEEITYEVKEERDNLHSMLADLLAEVQQMD